MRVGLVFAYETGPTVLAGDPDMPVAVVLNVLARAEKESRNETQQGDSEQRQIEVPWASRLRIRGGNSSTYYRRDAVK